MVTAPEAAASIVGHMKQTPVPQTVAARSPVTFESATLSATSPMDASRQETHNNPTDESFFQRPFRRNAA